MDFKIKRILKYHFFQNFDALIKFKFNEFLELYFNDFSREGLAA